MNNKAKIRTPHSRSGVLVAVWGSRMGTVVLRMGKPRGLEASI